MRSLFPFGLALALLPGCLGGSNSIQGPTTLGDQGRTVWQVSDGLCGGGLFDSACDLGVRVAVGATPLVQIRGHGGTSLDRATLTGGADVTITNFATSTNSDGTLLQANVGRTTAGVADLIVFDASGHEIDRAHLTFAAATTLTCGDLATASARTFAFPGLSGAPVSITEMPADGGSASTTSFLACRASDASGNALLSVDAIAWSLGTGATGMVSVTSDDAFGSTPARGGTARIVTRGAGSATVVASMNGTVMQSISVSFH